MGTTDRLEVALRRTLERACDHDCPPSLGQALRYAVFPGGGRVRPQLCLTVAAANGMPNPEASMSAAVALELMHCASLVHDDLPAFDDAAMRRGQPSVHHVYGEATATLVGDGLIVEAFAELARGGASTPELTAQMVAALGRATGTSRGIVAGQAWEGEASIDLERYHRAKTAALFEAATVLGAVTSGATPQAWRAVGTAIGSAYQLADDLADALSDAKHMGKPSGQDALHDRPSAVRSLGVEGAQRLLLQRLEEARAAIPPCPRRDTLAEWLAGVATRLHQPAAASDARADSRATAAADRAWALQPVAG